jgi:hypothetical protein
LIVQKCGLIAPDKTLADHLPRKLTLAEFKDILRKNRVVLICWPFQTTKSIMCGLLTISAMSMKLSVVCLMGINSTLALMGLYYKITSDAPDTSLSRFTGIMYLLGLGNTVKSFSSHSGSSHAPKEFIDCANTAVTNRSGTLH